MIALLALAAAIVATPAHAHGTLAGGGGFYAGLSHAFLTAEHFLLLLALGLLLGRQPRRSPRAPLLALALALAAGLVVDTGSVWPEAARGVLVAGMLAGAALALAVPVPPPAAALLAAGCGLAVGLDTDVAIATGGAIHAPHAGATAGVFLIVLNAMALASLARRPPATVAVRIAGSWIVAVAAMLLALQFRHMGGAA